MGARINAAQVIELVKTSLTEEQVATSMVDTANALVDEHLTSKGLSNRMLAKIELYLAAHFVALTEERGSMIRTQFGIGDVEEEMANVYSAGFNATRFGQQALTFDTTGTLVRLSSTKPKAEIVVV